MILRENAEQATGGFRHALRVDTRAAHDGAEAVFARFHADPENELAWFLAAQRSGLAAMEAARAPDDRLLCATLLEDLLERLDFDLAELGVRSEPVMPPRALCGMAIDYLVLGSRLGTEVLRRGLEKTQARDAMPTYFLSPAIGPVWQRHCRHLDEVDRTSVEAARILDDVQQGFALFEEAARVQDLPSSVFNPPSEGTAS